MSPLAAPRRAAVVAHKGNKQSSTTKYFFIVQEMEQEGHGGVQTENKEGTLGGTKNTARLHLIGKKTNAGLFVDQPTDLHVPPPQLLMEIIGAV